MYGAGARMRNGAFNHPTPRRDSLKQQMGGGAPLDNSRPIGVPAGQSASGNGQQQQRMGTAAPFTGRSPPAKQNTSHVPCKFFRQGACQAGKACPFSHDIAASVDVTCKYFAKGNCKFGPKCANVHVLPDGRRVNYTRGGVSMSGGPLNLGGRVHPDQYNYTSTLTDSLYQAQPMPPLQYPYDSYQATNIAYDMSRMTMGDADPSSPQMFANDAQDAAAPNFPNLLDVQLPASFENNSNPWIARQGPVSASVPRDFGIGPLPQSMSDMLTGQKDARTSEVLKTLHSSAYSDDTRDRFNGVATSPALNAYVKDEELYSKRPMHSQRVSKPSVISASLPPAGLVDADWDTHFTFEEDYIPNELSHLLTAQERARRMSKNGDDVLSASGTPDTSSKFGSPSNASPSGWSSLRQRQQRDEEMSSGRVSDFALVGSPLRNSSILSSSIGTRSNARSLSGAFDQSPWIASPPRTGSLLTGMFQKATHLNASTVPDTGSASTPRSAPIGTARKMDLDRTASSSSVINNRATSPIDEEQGDDFVFSMDEEVKESKESNEIGVLDENKPSSRSYATTGTTMSDANDNGPPGTSHAIISNQGRTFRMLDGDS